MKGEKSILAFIEMQVKKEGYPPSVREICKSSRIKFNSNSTWIYKKLSEKGYISKVDQKGRTLRVVKGGKYKNQEQISQMQSETGQDIYTAKEMVNVPVIGKNNSRRANISSRKHNRHIPNTSRLCRKQ